MFKIAVLVSGNGTNLQAIIDHYLNNPDIKISLVISNKKDAYALKRASLANIPTMVISKKDFPVILENMIRKFIKNHKLSKVAHEEIMAMTHSDLEVAKLFRKSEMDMTNKVAKILLANKFDGENIYEKVHISIAMVDNLCHEIVYHKHTNMNYDIMIDLVIQTIINLLN